MAILANRVKSDKILIKYLSKLLSKFLRNKNRVRATIVLFVCFILVFPARFVNNILLEFDGTVTSFTGNVFSGANNFIDRIYSYFIDFHNLEKENLELKIEISNLRKKLYLLEQKVAENKDLEKLLNLKNNNTKFITAKVEKLVTTPFSNSMLIKSGTNDDVKVNDLVLGERGLIGIVSNVSNNYSKILLLDDNHSRVPVITSSSKVRGILSKQRNKLKIIYLEKDHNIENDEIVYTSGDGKIFPRLIPVAKVNTISSNEVVVNLLDDYRNLNFVKVVSNDNPY